MEYYTYYNRHKGIKIVVRADAPGIAWSNLAQKMGYSSVQNVQKHFVLLSIESMDGRILLDNEKKFYSGLVKRSKSKIRKKVVANRSLAKSLKTVTLKIIASGSTFYLVYPNAQPIRTTKDKAQVYFKRMRVLKKYYSPRFKGKVYHLAR